MGKIEDYAQAAQFAISEHYDHGHEHATLVGREMELEAGRTQQKMDAILRIKAGDNPLNGRPHSASSAEEQVETDHQYRAYLQAQSEIVTAKNMAYTRRESARLQAELSIALVRQAAHLEPAI